MKTKYIVPETVVVNLNSKSQFLQTEVFGGSKKGRWEDGANTVSFEEDIDEINLSTPNLWDE